MQRSHLVDSYSTLENAFSQYARHEASRRSQLGPVILGTVAFLFAAGFAACCGVGIVASVAYILAFACICIAGRVALKFDHEEQSARMLIAPKGNQDGANAPKADTARVHFVAVFRSYVACDRLEYFRLRQMISCGVWTTDDVSRFLVAERLAVQAKLTAILDSDTTLA